MVMATPQDQGHGAVVAYKHRDGKSVTQIDGPFESVEKAQAHAEALAVANKHLSVYNLTPPDQ